MAFVNEKISDQDREKIKYFTDYKKIKQQASYMPEYDFPRTSFWACDNERGVYLIFLTGGGREQTVDYYALMIDNQVIVFNVRLKIKGNNNIGMHQHADVYDLRIVEKLQSRAEEIKQLIYEGLREQAYLYFTANGGTVANPNLTARANILSFEVEFKAEE